MMGGQSDGARGHRRGNGALHVQRALGARAWHLYIAGCPKCNPQSAQSPPVLQSAPIRNPPC
eukprot:9544551-Alexandrium_andersonii.AAC.1